MEIVPELIHTLFCALKTQSFFIDKIDTIMYYNALPTILQVF